MTPTLIDATKIRPHTGPAATGPAAGAVPRPVRITGRLRRFAVARAPRAAAVIAAVLGVLSILGVAAPDRLRALALLAGPIPVPAQAVATATAVVVGLLFLRIASGLRRGKQVEWRIAVAAGTVLAVADLARAERRPVDAVLAVLLVVLLVIARDRFRGRADPRSRWFGLRVAAQFLLAGTAVGFGMLALPGHVPAGTSYVRRAAEVAGSLVGLGGTVPISDDLYGDVFHIVLLTLGLAGLALGLVVAMRPPRALPGLSAADEAGLRQVLRRYGCRDSLGYFALRDDKSAVWSPSGKAAVTYRVVSGVALVSGDPIGDPEAWPGALAAYRELVARNGWTPAVIGASEVGARIVARELGLRSLALGDEAVVDATSFALDGRAMRGVRQAYQRVHRLGYEVMVRRARDVLPSELAELRAAAVAWRKDPVERGFSMALSRLGDERDPDCVVVTARRAGRLHGLLHFVPWGESGISLDLMRRDPSANNGLNEFMITATIAAAAELGIDQVSLNFAVFRDALERGGRIGAGPVARLWRRSLLVASRWWQIDSLYRFNEKFHPDWQPRFISYPAARDLPRIAFAALEAEAFVVRPRLRATTRAV